MAFIYSESCQPASPAGPIFPSNLFSAQWRVRIVLYNIWLPLPASGILSRAWLQHLLPTNILLCGKNSPSTGSDLNSSKTHMQELGRRQFFTFIPSATIPSATMIMTPPPKDRGAPPPAPLGDASTSPLALDPGNVQCSNTRRAQHAARRQQMSLALKVETPLAPQSKSSPSPIRNPFNAQGATTRNSDHDSIHGVSSTTFKFTSFPPLPSVLRRGTDSPASFKRPRSLYHYLGSQHPYPRVQAQALAPTRIARCKTRRSRMPQCLHPGARAFAEICHVNDVRLPSMGVPLSACGYLAPPPADIAPKSKSSPPTCVHGI
ncbi:hypothetical protein C8F01DRAFT_1093076 [Mycena amicta]|nr:hypothetical protein C8F01DRAFT_1093076 [Mycena amicta]